MRRLAALAAVVLASLMATTGAAPAQTAWPPSQDQPSSTWAQPGTAPLDAMGTFVYVAAAPPKATQGSLYGYEYTLSFRLEDRTGGLVVVGYQNGHKVAGFILTPQPVVTVPYDWQFGRPYFLYTKRFDATRWAAWIQDYWTGAVTFIGFQPAAASAGGIAPASARTTVDYGATLAPMPAGADPSTCAFYPEVHVLFFSPIGWRGATASVATRSGTNVQKGDCPSTSSFFYGWQYYRLGTTAA